MTTFDERLKDIKDFFLGDNEVAGALYDTSEIGELHPEVKEYIKWLIQQAERVEELEQVIGDLYEDIKELELLRIKEKRKNKHYKQALEFYANKENYSPDFSHNVDNDKGEIARQALEVED